MCGFSARETMLYEPGLVFAVFDLYAIQHGFKRDG